MPVSHIDPSVNVELQVAGFKRSFSSAVSPSRARGERAYLKSDDRFHGVTVPFIRHTAARFRRENLHLARPRLLGLVARLWQSPYHDLRSLGIALLEAYQELLRAGDFSVVEDMLRKSRTWDHVDWLSVKVAGSLVRRFKSSRRTLVRWSKDDNFWIRRASMLALLDVLRWDSRDLPLFERFASRMIDEREFFIRKAIGWVLREVSKRDPEPVDRFLTAYIARVPGLTLREGSKYLPSKRRDELLAAYRTRERPARGR